MKKIYLFDIDENTGKGVFQISQVEKPAIELDFVAFSKDANVHPNCKCVIEDSGEWKFEDGACDQCLELANDHNSKLGFMKFSIVSEEEMKIAGPIMIANKEIYRKELDGYIVWQDKTILKARSSFKKNNNNFAANIDHSNTKSPSFLLEDWIVEPGIPDKSIKWNYSFGKDLVWFGVFQVTDKDYWNKFIKTGLINGFSVEIDKSSVKIKENFNMEKPKIEKFGKAELADKTFIYWDGETVDVGTKIFLDEALTKAAPDGEYVDSTGSIVVTKDGAIIEVKPKDQTVMSEEKPTIEFLSKIEFNDIFTKLNSRVDSLESRLSDSLKKNEEMSKENEEIKKSIPGAPSFIFKKNAPEAVKVEKMTFSQQLKERLKSQGKFN